MKEVCVFLADGFEEVEALAPVDLLRRAGVKVTTISVMDGLEVRGSHNITVTADLVFNDKDYTKVNMLVLPGGMPGTLNLGAHAGLRKLIASFNGEGRHLAAICAAPSVFGKMGLLEGKKAVCYPGVEKELAGAETAESGAFVTDGNITTSRGAGTSIDFALELIRILEGEEKSAEIKEAIIYGKY